MINRRMSGFARLTIIRKVYMIFGRTVKEREIIMEISILLMEQIAELFLMILMGYIIVKTGLLKGEDSKVISKIVLYLVIPCVIINAFQVDYTSEKVKELLLVFAASVLLQVILLAAVWGAGKVLKLNEVETTSIYYSNSGNLIVPLVTFILGKNGYYMVVCS